VLGFGATLVDLLLGAKAGAEGNQEGSHPRAQVPLRLSGLARRREQGETTWALSSLTAIDNTPRAQVHSPSNFAH
jgi:hypothetical protein